MGHLKWLISGWVRISEKIVTILFSVKNWPKNGILTFLPTQFSKNYKINMSSQNQRKILSARVPSEKPFDPWIKSYEAFSIFRTSAFLEVMICNFMTYGYNSNQHLAANSKQSFFYLAHANSFKWDFLLNA